MRPILSATSAGSAPAHWLGAEPGWGKWEYDDEDGGAGKDADRAIDMLRMTIRKA